MTELAEYYWDEWDEYYDPALDGYDYDEQDDYDLDTNEQEDDMDFNVKGLSRDGKIAKRKHGMRVDGRSVFVIQSAQAKRDQQKRGSK